MSHADDLELLRAWRAGDELAGARLVERHSSVLFRFFGARVDAAEAGDLAQRTFLACLEGSQRGPTSVSFRAYLLGIARNKLLHHLRKLGREDRALTAAAQEPAASILSASRQVAVGEEQQLLLAAIRMLPIDLQLTVQLHYWEDLTVEEVSHVLEIPPGTVKSRLFRARASLRDNIATLAETDALRRETQDNLERWAASLRELLADPGLPEHE